MWRGPDGDGTTAEKDLPLKWSAGENVAWKALLPEAGNSTPVVWGDRVFVTQAAEGLRLLFCFDRNDGTLLWKEGVRWEKEELTHKTNPYCSGSPATDGERVIVSFASAGVHAFDFNGKKLWSRDLGQQRHIWGYGSSPVLHEDLCFLNFGPGENQALVAMDKRTGEVVWTHKEPGGSSGEGGGKNWRGAWSDPLARTVDGREELLMTFSGRVCAFDPANGTELWNCDGLNALVYTSPLFADGVALGMGGYRGNGVAVRAGGNGDVTATHRLWKVEQMRQRIGSGVIHEGHVYILTDPGIAECRSMATGELIWEERLKGPGPTGQNWSSVVLDADGLCHAVNQGGDAFVFRASPTFELLATNSIGERVIGSIAVSDGQLFIRSHEHLWCIGERR
jgi:outer membrane protein assembly factor BamB